MQTAEQKQLSESERAKIVERIQKCFAHVGNNPNEHEVANAVRVAKKLMAEYNLSMSDVENHEAEDGQQVEFEMGEAQADTARNYGKYEYMIAQVCDQLFECRHFFYCRWDGSKNARVKTLTFVGVPAEAALASQVYHLLRKMVMRMARAKFGQQKWSMQHNSYALGFAAELYARSDKPAEEYAGNRSLALVVVNKEQALTQWFEQQDMKTTKSRRPSNVDGMAYGMGRVDGKSVNLNFRNVVNA